MQEDTARTSGLAFAPYLRREPVLLAGLFVLAIVLFLAVTGLSRLFHAQQDALGQRWFERGVADLRTEHYDSAVLEFRAALRYSRDNYLYQFNLAEALIGQKHTGEAYAYLIGLWDRQPEDGLVNRELARIAAQQGETEQALRYYHNAIYATWSQSGGSADEDAQRRETRLELIEYLLRLGAKTQAQSELIALAANTGNDGDQEAQIGQLFSRAQDYEHALTSYRASLRLNRHNASALAGAGFAAFQLGQYEPAHRYLEAATAADANDSQSADLFKTTELVLQMDPFQRGISAVQRNKLVMLAFATAGERLKSCGSTSGATAQDTTLSENWTKLKSKISEAGLRQNPDLAEEAMDVVFNIERQTAASCGSPTGADLALLLIAKQHEGN
jgi:tetratricopeptide (TPR) repeat protein